MATSPSKPVEFDISKEAPKITALISQWTSEKDATTVRRQVRIKEYNVAEMREKKEIDPDATYIARRIIDSNIRREKPEFASFIETSPRLVLFKSLSSPAKDTVNLADWFTLGMRYNAWSEIWHRTFDATATHGASFVEIKADDSTPFNIRLEYTPREMLIIPVCTRRSIQKCERIIRVYEYLPNELEDFVESHDFSKEAVKRITEKHKESDRDKPNTVYKVFCRKNGIIYVSWYSEECKDLWLKAPQPLYLGLYKTVPAQDGTSQLTPIPVDFFPFVGCLYEFIEDETILAVKGRAFRDLPDQDALSKLWSGLVNGTDRACRLHGSFVQQMGTEGLQAEPIEGGMITPREVKYWQAAYPDPSILTTVQALSSENAQAAGKMDYAAANRKDSRKTATELAMAQEQSGKLSSVNMIPMALALSEVYSFCWLLVQSQVLNGVITAPDHIAPDDFTDEYELVAAGDTEVIKRAEKISNLQQDIPLFAGTPVGMDMQAKYLELRFPDEAIRWKEKLAQPDLRPVVAQLVQVLESAPLNISPEERAALDNLLQNAKSTAGVPAGPQPMAGPNSNPNNANQPQPAGGGVPAAGGPAV